ncbi:MAG: hypothetical protein KJZ78_17450, partial [Bryobacteraceae bacterium]|nr:hypothetical protein [Bryobacteraceae bacterium]
MSKVATSDEQAEIARRIRTRLESEISPEARDFEMVWALEFRTRPLQEHAALRKQVAKDVERLLALKPDKRSVGTILSGMKQSGASKDDLAAFEERVLKEAPASYTAYTIAYDRWKKDHKEPESHKDTSAWDAWKAANRAATKEWAARFTEVLWLADSYLYARIEAGEISEAEAVQARDQSVNKREARSGGDMWFYINAATPLLKKG